MTIHWRSTFAFNFSHDDEMSNGELSELKFDIRGHSEISKRQKKQQLFIYESFLKEPSADTYSASSIRRANEMLY